MLYIIFSFVLLLFIMFIGLIFTKENFPLIILSSAFSILIGVIYALLMNTDLAITEFVISSALSSIVLIFALLYIENKYKIKKKPENKILTGVIFLLTTSLIYFVIDDIINLLPRAIFDFDTSYSKNFYIQNSEKTFLIPSFVTSIVAGYRALDTLFECAVIFFGSIVFYITLQDKDKIL